MYLLNNLKAIDTTSVEDLEEVVSEIAECMNQNHLACRFLRGWYGISAFDIDHDPDVIALMSIGGYGKSARAIAALCDCFGHHAMWYDGDFRRATNDEIEREVYDIARSDWDKFYQNVFSFFDAVMQQTEMDFSTISAILEAISLDWTVEVLAKFCGK